MDVDIREVLRVYDGAALPILQDPDAWLRALSQVASQHGQALAFPRLANDSAEWLAVTMFNATADHLLTVAREPAELFEPLAVSDDELRSVDVQTILRVAHDANEAGMAAVVGQFGGARRITGKRDFRAGTDEHIAAWARRLARQLGVNQDRVFEIVGIGRRRAYRAGERAAYGPPSPQRSARLRAKKQGKSKK